MTWAKCWFFCVYVQIRRVSSDFFWVPLKVCMTSEDTGPLQKACHAKTWPQVNLKKSSVVNRIPLWVKPCSEFQLAVFWVCSSCHFLTTRLPDSSQGVMRKSRNRGKRAAKEFMFFCRLLEICHICSDIRVFFFF